MKQRFKCVLRDYLSKCLENTRKAKGLTQTQFSEHLMMYIRSYISLEHGDNLCCTLTFILFLCFHCKDVDGLIRDLREIILNAQDANTQPLDLSPWWGHRPKSGKMT